MNAKVTDKYKNLEESMKSFAIDDTHLDNETNNCSSLIKRINEIEESIKRIELAAYRLEKYATKLEDQFKIVFPE